MHCTLKSHARYSCTPVFCTSGPDHLVHYLYTATYARVRLAGCLSIIQHLRSASQRKLIVPRYRLNSFGRQCFAIAGPSTMNLLPDSLRDPALSLNMFRRQLKTYFFCEILKRCTQHIRDLLIKRYVNLHFTYLLTCK